MSSPGANVRAAAAWVVDQVFSQGQSLKAVLSKARIEFTDSRDRALLESMSLSVIRNRRSLEFALSKLMKKPLPAAESLNHGLLLVGLAQLHILKLSEHAAVSATVNAAKLLGKSNHAGLINAVLRRSVREGLAQSDDPAIISNHPDWLIKQFKADWPEHWQQLIDANNAQAPLWIRVNGHRILRAEYSELLKGAGIEHWMPEYPSQALCIEKSIAPTQLPGWQEGLLTVQDVSAQLAAEALAVEDGMTVLDMCAAPGGKSAQLAEKNLSMLVLLDKESLRVQKIHELFARMQLAEVGVVMQVGDATQELPTALPQHYDAIL